MKVLSLIILVFAYCFDQAQNNSIKKDAAKEIKEFYINYITVVATEPAGASGEKKLEMLQKEYCTKAFFKRIPEIIKKTDADPFLKAQDSDIQYLKTLTVVKDLQKSHYIVSYMADAAPGEKITITIKVTVVKEGDNYKIDSVE